MSAHRASSPEASTSEEATLKLCLPDDRGQVVTVETLRSADTAFSTRRGGTSSLTGL